MPSLDTNVLLRHLIRDDARQGALVEQLMSRCIQESIPLFIPATVLLELEWVLRSRFGLDKAQVIEALAGLAASSETMFESEEPLEVALELFRTSSADFADCLHVAVSARMARLPLWTFDRKAASLMGASLLAA